MHALRENEQKEDEDDDIENASMIKATKKPARRSGSRGKGGKPKKGFSTEVLKGKGKGKLGNERTCIFIINCKKDYH